jgi:[ribosomal protein S5]-alanine N-acetyltransferase
VKDFVIETARTILSPWRPEDWLHFRPIATDPLVMRYIAEGKPWPDERIQSFVARQITNYGSRAFCLWKMTSRDSLGPPKKLMGFCGIQPWLDTAEIEIGWWLTQAFWGQGIATECARAAMRDAFERVGLKRVIAVAQPANRASTRIMEKIGMTYERDAAPRGIPVVLYSISSADYHRAQTNVAP